jgi:cell wall assembly regulator SMI1
VERIGQEPSAEQVQEVLKAVKAGSAKATEKAETNPKPAPAAEHAPSPAPSASYPAPATPTSHPAPTTAGDKVTMLLARLDQWLNTHRERFQQALQDGATARECDELTAVLGRPLPEELRAVLMWHNGQNPDVPGSFEDNWILMSTEEIAEAKKELDAEAHEGWRKSWLPFLDNDSGDYRCLDLDSAGSPVLECWRGRADHPVIAPSLAAWLEGFVSALERGAYAEDPERGSLLLRS